MFKNQIKTRSELNYAPDRFCVYKTSVYHNNKEFVYYGKQSFSQEHEPDPFYVGSGRLLKEKIEEISDSDTIEKNVLKTFDNEKEALDFEAEMIKKGKTAFKNRSLNLKSGSGGNVLGLMTADDYENRSEKISSSLTGRRHSEQTKQKIREAKLGVKRSPEACKAISEGRKGKTFGKRSSETIEKMKAAQQARRIRELGEN
ncbi:NUMOD3 domain-containing DNA-binding protein [Serratia marcescens]|uniref:NUMOD3 domain-containing DNA-binding protein n=1 Tax=Serratia TaxID=613 RepID=UPI00313D6EBB